jgi:serine/threonine-protein kinase
MRASNIGRYELLEELSRGGMGVVYKARDPLIDRVVAIKTIGMGLSRLESEAFDKRFDREARSAGRLNHPNIVTIHDMGRSDDGAYIAMEFLDGRSLRDILDTGVVLEPARVAHIAVQIADGLAYAHEHDVIHCDIKPANIMVLPSGLVKITDFGIARLPTGSRTFAGNVFGSPRYISPEQILGRPIDARSDIFSLGAVIYEMLTGVPPFGGGELDEILFQVINDKPEPPTSRNASIPAAFDAIIDRALAKSPGDRYATAGWMAADLRKLLPAEAPPAAASLPAVSNRKRKSKRDATTTVLISGPAGDGGVHLESPTRALDVRTLRLRRVWRNVVVYGVPLVAIAVASTWLLLQGRASSAKQPAEVVAPTPIAPVASAPEPAASVSPAATPSNDPQPSSAVGPATPPKPVVAKPQARLTLAVSPWGEVFVDGRKRGVSPPLTELNLAPGRHTIEIRNSAFAPHSETIDVLADASVRIKHKFE